MITREQLADLQPGDVVELRFSDWASDNVIRGSVYARFPDQPNYLWLGPISFSDGMVEGWTLTVVSRAPRPLYVNHDRTEPVPGDVVRDADGVVWLRDSWATWHSPDSICNAEHEDVGLTKPWTLLVDGTTGQVVP